MEEGDYFSRLLAYVHLNPVRAGLVKKRDGLESYPWSSLSDYVAPVRKRRSWIAVERGLEQLEYPDTAVGRRHHLEWLEGCVDWKNPAQAGDRLPDGQSLQATFRRGWYFGSEAFREKLIDLLKHEAPDVSEKRRKGYSAVQTRDHGVTEARRILALAEDELGITDWNAFPKGDWRKGLVAGIIRQRALVGNEWLAEHLAMGVRNAVSRTIRLAREGLVQDRRIAKLAKALEHRIEEG